MILTDVSTVTMSAEEIYLGKTDSANAYKDIPIEPEPTGDLTVTDTLQMLNQLGTSTDD